MRQTGRKDRQRNRQKHTTTEGDTQIVKNNRCQTDKDRVKRKKKVKTRQAEQNRQTHRQANIEKTNKKTNIRNRQQQISKRTSM